MIRRLIIEARLLALDDPQDVNPSSLRWQYMWHIARVDLHQGLSEMAVVYATEAQKAFTNQVGALTCVAQHAPCPIIILVHHSAIVPVSYLVALCFPVLFAQFVLNISVIKKPSSSLSSLC